MKLKILLQLCAPAVMGINLISMADVNSDSSDTDSGSVAKFLTPTLL